MTYKMRNYRMTVMYGGLLDRTLDRAIMRVVHAKGEIEFEGSGWGMGQRDLSFIVPSSSYARGIKARLNKLDKKIRVECKEAFE